MANTYQYEGRMVSGIEVDMESSSEPFAQITLSDGTVVKAKMVMLSAVRLDAFTPAGDPVYQFQFQQIVGISAPQELKRKVQ